MSSTSAVLDSKKFVCPGILSEKGAAELARQIESKTPNAARLMDLEIPMVVSLYLEQQLWEMKAQTLEPGLAMAMTVDRANTLVTLLGMPREASDAIAAAISEVQA